MLAESLCKTYGDNPALQNVTLRVNKGGIHGILGPVGAGKSTLLRILAGVENCDANGGSVTLNGRQISVDAREAKARIGYVADSAELIGDMTVSELLDFVGDARGVPAEKRARQIKEALSLVGLEELKNRLCGRLTPEQKKGTALAAALLGNPEVILIDEPFRGRGEKRSETLSVLRMLGKVKTVVIATADLKPVQELCEDVTILCDGRTLVSDSLARVEEKLAADRSLVLVTATEEPELLGQRITELNGVSDCAVERRNGGDITFRIDYRSAQDIRTELSTLLAEMHLPVLGMKIESFNLETLYRTLAAPSTKKARRDGREEQE